MPHGCACRYAGEDIPLNLTVLLYIKWEPQQGGQLCAQLPSGERNISPKPGRLVIFFSQEIEHQVLKCSMHDSK